MQIVIDIDDNLYTRLFDNGVDNYDDAVDMAKTIRKGTVLSKGHGRLIDADTYKEKIFRVFPCNDRDDQNIRRSTEMAILSVPTIVEADKENRE